MLVILHIPHKNHAEVDRKMARVEFIVIEDLRHLGIYELALTVGLRKNFSYIST